MSLGRQNEGHFPPYMHQATLFCHPSLDQQTQIIEIISRCFPLNIVDETRRVLEQKKESN